MAPEKGWAEDRLDSLDKKVDAWLDVNRKRFGDLDRTLLWSAVGVITTLIACCATLTGVAAL